MNSKRKTVDFVQEFNIGRVSSVHISGDDEQVLTVNFSVPVPGFDSLAEVSEDIILTKQQHSRLREAVNAMYDEIEKTIKEGVNVSTNPCGTCNSNCCSHFSDGIFCTHEDVHRIMEFRDVPESTFFESMEGNITYHAKVKKKDIDGVSYCIFFDDEKRNCGIHRIKPQVCQDYSPHNCGLWKEDSEKIVQLRRKNG